MTLSKKGTQTEVRWQSLSMWSDLLLHDLIVVFPTDMDWSAVSQVALTIKIIQLLFKVRTQVQSL